MYRYFTVLFATTSTTSGQGKVRNLFLPERVERIEALQWLTAVTVCRLLEGPE